MKALRNGHQSKNIPKTWAKNMN